MQLTNLDNIKNMYHYDMSINGQQYQMSIIDKEGALLFSVCRKDGYKFDKEFKIVKQGLGFYDKVSNIYRRLNSSEGADESDLKVALRIVKEIEQTKLAQSYKKTAFFKGNYAIERD